MAEQGSVSRNSVVEVLSAVSEVLGVSMKVEGTTLTLVKDGIPEVYSLPDQVTRRFLQRISSKYGVKIEYFYHPEMCCKGNTTQN